MSFYQRLRTNFKPVKYLSLMLSTFWLSISLVGCNGWLTGQPTDTAEQIANATAETVPTQRFDGNTIHVLTRAGAIGSGVERRIHDFETLTGAKVNLETVPYGQLYDTLQTDWKSANSTYDMAIASPQWLIDFVNAGYIEDLSTRIETDTALQWDDIAPIFRNVSTAQNGSIYGIPVDGDHHLVYYRADLLKQAGLAPPNTWNDYLEIAQQFHGKDLNGDNTPDYGSCIAKEPGHVGYFMMSSIATSYLQSEGTKQGAFFDPDTMKPLVNNEAFAEALDIYKKTAEYGTPDDINLTFTGARDTFMAGRCALILDWGDIPTLAANPANSKVVDLVGTAITPGSEKVLDRATGNLIACDKFTCPYAINGINHAPYAANLGYVGIVSTNTTPTVKDTAYAFASYLSQPEQANVDVTIGETGFNPYRMSQFENVSPWIEAGLSADTANNFLSAIGVTLSSPNMALDLKLPYGKRYQLEVLDPAIADFMAEKITREDAMERIEQGWEKITNEVGRENQKADYLTSLGLSS